MKVHKHLLKKNNAIVIWILSNFTCIFCKDVIAGIFFAIISCQKKLVCLNVNEKFHEIHCIVKFFYYSMFYSADISVSVRILCMCLHCILYQLIRNTPDIRLLIFNIKLLAFCLQNVALFDIIASVNLPCDKTVSRDQENCII